MPRCNVRVGLTGMLKENHPYRTILADVGLGLFDSKEDAEAFICTLDLKHDASYHVLEENEVIVNPLEEKLRWLMEKSNA